MRGLDPALTFLRHPVASLRAPRIVVDVRDEPPLVLLYPATGPRALLALLAGLGALLWLPAGVVLLSALVLACWRWGGDPGTNEAWTGDAVHAVLDRPQRHGLRTVPFAAAVEIYLAHRADEWERFEAEVINLRLRENLTPPLRQLDEDEHPGVG